MKTEMGSIDRRPSWSSPVRTALGVSFVLVGLLSGCRLPIGRTPALRTPEVLSAQPTAQELAAAVNANAGQVGQLQSQVRLSVQDLPGLSGQLIYERPRRLRLQARLLGVGGPGVDVGSNESDFWMWFQTSLPSSGPMFVHANHERFASTLAQQRLPLQAEWISDALGLATIPPDATLAGPFARNDRNWELHVVEQVPSGTLTRILVIERGTARVLEQHWYDDARRSLAIAQATDFEYLQPPGVNLPRRVILTIAPYTTDKMTLTLQMSGLRVNQSVTSAATFEMPDPGNTPRIDLGAPGAWMQETAATAPPAVTNVLSGDDPTSSAFRPQYRGRTLR
ncbi:MAG TPA: hypothetical protein DCQ98_14710 [Planctomycetaceae bacterium]|nr:hypothetical protein [Planctomycetaceae bacterium]HRF00982.1 hypothetical protein [Pirellulaceae bacterium]